MRVCANLYACVCVFVHLCVYARVCVYVYVYAWMKIAFIITCKRNHVVVSFGTLKHAHSHIHVLSLLYSLSRSLSFVHSRSQRYQWVEIWRVRGWVHIQWYLHTYTKAHCNILLHLKTNIYMSTADGWKCGEFVVEFTYSGIYIHIQTHTATTCNTKKTNIYISAANG